MTPTAAKKSSARHYPLLLCLLPALLGLSNPAAASTTLRFVTQDFPPYSYLSQGQPDGPAVQLVRRICERLPDIECAITLLPWRRALRLVQLGDVDGAFVLGYNREREAWIHFSPPLLAIEYGLFVRSDSPLTYQEPQDLRGLRVAVFGPSNTSRSLYQLTASLKDTQVQMSHDDDTGFRQLAAGRVDAVYSNRDVGLAMMERLGLTNLRYAGKDRALTYHIGFSRRVSAGLLQRFETAYRDLWRSGEADRLLAPYRLQSYPLE